MKTQILKFVLPALVVGFVAISMSTPAEARRSCVFKASNPWTGQTVADGKARAKNMRRACRRAKRRCNRELTRKRRKGAVANGCRYIR